MWVGPGAYPSVEPLKGTLFGYSPALPENIKLGWKSIPETNTLLITKVHKWRRKKFFNIGPRLFSCIFIIHRLKSTYAVDVHNLSHISCLNGWSYKCILGLLEMVIILPPLYQWFLISWIVEFSIYLISRLNFNLRHHCLCFNEVSEMIFKVKSIFLSLIKSFIV